MFSVVFGGSLKSSECLITLLLLYYYYYVLLLFGKEQIFNEACLGGLYMADLVFVGVTINSVVFGGSLKSSEYLITLLLLYYYYYVLLLFGKEQIFNEACFGGRYMADLVFVSVTINYFHSTWQIYCSDG